METINIIENGLLINYAEWERLTDSEQEKIFYF